MMMTTEKRELKPGDAIYHREYGHGTLDRRSGAVCHLEGGGTENGWCATFNGRTPLVWPHTRGTIWDLADSHGPHNAGRVMVGLEEGGYPELTAAVDYWLARGSPYAPGYKLDRDRPGYAILKTDGTWSGVRWATPEEQAAYYEERGDEGAWGKREWLDEPDPSFGQLVSEEQLRQEAKKAAEAPLVPVQPKLPPSPPSCSSRRGAPNPHADCKGCGGKKGLHGRYSGCRGRSTGETNPFVTVLNRVLALAYEKRAQDLRRYGKDHRFARRLPELDPDDVFLQDAKGPLHPR